MTVTYSLGPNPKWYIADNFGDPLGGGYMTVRSSLNPSELKPVYMDPGGAFPWPTNGPNNSILFDENGSQGPFYWEFDSSAPDDLYYLEVFSSDGTLVWTINNYIPPGEGGGGNVTTTVSLKNYVVNGQFWHCNSIPASLAVDNIIGPSCHSGIDIAHTDIRLVKNNTAATDSVTITKFTLGSNDLAGDVTPEFYLNYECTNTPVGETFKDLTFPVCAHVQNLQNQDVTLVVWARYVTIPTTITVYLEQYFGDGGAPSTTVEFSVQTLALTTGWVKYIMQTAVPAVGGKTLGACGNDVLLMKIRMPLNTASQVHIAKPAFYLGHIVPDEEFDSYDQIDSIVNAPRTGDVRMTFNPRGTATGIGWVIMNDGTIGSAASAATTRANVDTFFLYQMLWVNVIDAYAPVSGGRGVSAFADFTANKTIGLTKTLGRVMSSTGIPSTGGTDWQLGQPAGSETHTLTIAEMPSHNHPGSFAPATTNDAGGGHFEESNGPTNNLSLNIATQGQDQPHNIMQPTTHSYFFIKL